MLHRITVGAGITAGLLVAVLLTTAIDHGAGDNIAPPIRGLMIAALIILAVGALLGELAEQIRRTEDRIREQVAAVVHEEVVGAVADAYRTGAIMTVGATPLRSVARE
jgi:hypothetical protein